MTRCIMVNSQRQPLAEISQSEMDQIVSDPKNKGVTGIPVYYCGDRYFPPNHGYQVIEFE